MHFTKNITGIFCALIIIGAINNNCIGKSVFVIPSIGDTEIRAYKIDGSSLTYQASADVTYSSPVGITVHESDYGRWLFARLRVQIK